MIQMPPHAPVERYWLDVYHRLNIDIRFYERLGWLWPVGVTLFAALLNLWAFPRPMWWISVAVVAFGISLATYGHLRILRKQRAHFAKTHPAIAAQYDPHSPNLPPCPNP